MRKHNFYSTESFDFIYVLCKGTKKIADLRLIGEYNESSGAVDFHRILWNDEDVTRCLTYVMDEWSYGMYEHLKEVVDQHCSKVTIIDLDESDYTLQNQ